MSLCTGEGLPVARIIEEGLNYFIHLLLAGRDAHTLTPHIGGTDGETPLDQRIDDLHSAAEFGDLATARSREELLLLVADSRPALVFGVHSFEFADVLSGLFESIVCGLDLSIEASILGDVLIGAIRQPIKKAHSRLLSL